MLLHVFLKLPKYISINHPKIFHHVVEMMTPFLPLIFKTCGSKYYNFLKTFEICHSQS